MYTLIFVFIRTFLVFIFVTGFTFGLFLEHCFHLIILVPKFPKTEKIPLRADVRLACGTVFENHQKCLILQAGERSELRNLSTQQTGVKTIILKINILRSRSCRNETFYSGFQTAWDG